MEVLKVTEILNATGGLLLGGNESIEFTGICTDSRKIKNGELFIPLIGENFDGHDYIANAVSAGAAGFITQKPVTVDESVPVIKVNHTLKALHNIASYYRNKFNIKVVAVTGSVGKTSTKDMIASVLEQKYNVLKTMGNFNNQIGLPLTLFDIEKSHDVVVLEMGMNSLGEIELLSKIAQPDIAVITNIGIAHIERLGSRQNILKAKMEILQGLKPDGVLILNADDALLSGFKNFIKVNTKYYGMEEEADVRASNVKLECESRMCFDVTVKNSEHSYCLPVLGRHNVYNALSAITVGLELNVQPQDIERGLISYTQEKMRMNILNVGGNIKVIDDTYNANPQSMSAAIDVLAEMKNCIRKIAVVGDMLELGDWSFKAHKEVGDLLYSKGIDYVITMGQFAKHIGDGAIESGMDSDKVKMFDNIEEINSFLISFIEDGDTILVKGSRGMRMERIVEYINIHKGRQTCQYI